MNHASRKLPVWIAAAGLALGPALASAQIAFTDVTDVSGAAHISESYGASFGDLDGDGYLDIFSSNHRTRPSLLLNMGDGTFFDTGGQVSTWVTHPNADTHGGSFADFENDGDQGPDRVHRHRQLRARCWSTRTAAWSTRPSP